ncbi:hypothetical protein I7X12_18245 [Halosimplex litoreum]|uniref:Uncharacterized protein n=1 Tax=Halosimplex litoreum TaxID=1198301 RepID=A0A7T3FXL0_9EURY|nr:hypothetical protein [Halosimplex litoreum]QPV62644.1 hypothetical protein I7X12_18245 [Halosimplex litoreum]
MTQDLYTTSGRRNYMSRYRRRSVLAGLAALGGLSGCSFEGSDPERSASPGSDEPTASDHSPSRTDTDTDTHTETAPRTPVPSVREVLPEAGDGWRLLDTGDVVPVPLTAEDHVRGDYRGPDGTEFRVVVMEFSRPVIAEFNAERLACEAEWSVALQYRTLAIAASTGTTQERLTPEHPPRMSQTALPGTSGDPRRLLRRSPVLSRDPIETGAIDSC